MQHIHDYHFPGGWNNGDAATQRALECCAQLEDNHILFFPSLPFALSPEDTHFLLSSRTSARRDVIYDPGRKQLRGAGGSAGTKQLQSIMQRYSQSVVGFLHDLLRPYRGGASPYFAHFRSDESARSVATMRRNDLIHTDALRNTATRGGRILRCFTNIDPEETRVWHITDPFPTLAAKYGVTAGLKRIASQREAKTGRLQKLFSKKTPERSKYDRFMVEFHDYLKLNEEYQRHYPKTRLEFPPHSTWICFTDSVPHAEVAGQYGLEQTMLVPVASMVTPEKAPLRVLEKLARVPMA